MNKFEKEIDEIKKEMDEITEKYRKEMQEKINKTFNSLLYVLMAIAIACFIGAYFCSKW